MNVYELITNLVKEKYDLLRQDHRIENYAHFGGVRGEAEFDKKVARYKQIDKLIKSIEKDYAIGIKEMGEIISKNKGETYIPKIFHQYDGRCYFGFAGCYISKNSRYYSNPNYEIDVSPTEFANIVCDNKKYIQFSDPGAKLKSPKEFYDSSNFIELYTARYFTLAIYNFCGAFIHEMKPMLRKELESIEVASVDETLSLV